jgi:hypothetical protein
LQRFNIVASAGAVMTVQCGSCKAENPDGKKFCGDCGGPLGAAAAKPPFNPALRDQVQEIIEQHYKDQKVVEIETTQAIASRLLDWAKLFGFFVGIPAAILLLILGLLGIKTYSDFSGQIDQAKKDVTLQLNAAQDGAKKLKLEGDSLASDYEKLRTQFANTAALNEQLQALSKKVDVIGEKLGFTPTSKISTEARGRLEDAFAKFQDYMKGLGYRSTTGSISIDIREKMEVGAIAYYEPEQRMMVIDSKYIDDSAVLYREYMHHVLYSSGMPKDPESILSTYYAIESGLAWYFPCSFIGDPNPSKNTVSWDLTKRRSFSEQGQDIGSAMFDGTEIWGGAFWEVRQILGKNTADKLLLDAWFKLQPDEVKTDRGASFVRKLFDLDNAHQEQIRAVFVRRGLAL